MADQQKEQAVSGSTPGKGAQGKSQAAGSQLSNPQASGSQSLATRGGVPSIFDMSPFSLMRRFTEDMDQLFSSVGIGRGMGTPWLGGIERDLLRGSNLGQGLWSPQIDVIQRGNDIVVRADLPGLGPNDVQLNVNDNVLTLEGERRQEQEERKGGIYRSERSYGSFSRSILLPEGADIDKIKASFTNGVLEVIVPIPQQAARGRRIEIQSGAGGQAGAQKPVH